MIIINTYTASELLTWTTSAEYSKLPVVPISPQRALSISKSPHTNATDVILACAYNNKNLVGYLGVLPDNILVLNTTHHLGWLTAMWVNPSQRGKGIAKHLINTLLTCWDNKLVTTNQSPEAAFVFNNHKQFVCKQNIGQRFYLKSRTQQLVSNKKVSSSIKKLLTIFDSVINILHQAKQRIDFQTQVNFTIEPNITAELGEFMLAYALQTICKRNQKYLQWVINYPWVYQSADNDKLKNQYEFTISTPDYSNKFLVCRNRQQQIVAVALVMIKNGELKVSYTWCSSNNNNLLNDALFCYAKQQGIFEISLFSLHTQNLFNPYSSNVIFNKSITRHYYISKDVHHIIGNITHPFLDGDGDCCFA